MINYKHTLIENIKDEKGKLLGCLVAIPVGDGMYSIGFSKFNYAEETIRFSKERAKGIAIGRALEQRPLHKSVEALGTVYCVLNYPTSFRGKIKNFVSRCRRYYKTDRNPVNWG